MSSRTAAPSAAPVRARVARASVMSFSSSASTSSNLSAGWWWQHTDLVKQSEPIRHTPVFDDLAVLEAAEVEHRDDDFLACGRMHGAGHGSRPDLVAVDDHVLDRDAHVRHFATRVGDLTAEDLCSGRTRR